VPADLLAALTSINGAWDDLVRARSVVPSLGAEAAGSVSFSMPPFYQQWGLNPALVFFQRPLTDSDVDRIKSAGHSINEGYVLRLHAILDAAGLLQAVLDKKDPVESRILLAKDLRNEIAHGRRYCNPVGRLHSKLLAQILESFYPAGLVDREPLLRVERDTITAAQSSGAPLPWPLSILGVLGPLTETALLFVERHVDGG
jgi:hypothetical protein